jgi:hypothetical protein
VIYFEYQTKNFIKLSSKKEKIMEPGVFRPQVQQVQTCNGCGKSTPFFGEVYGRMSEDFHGAKSSGMSHEFTSLDASEVCGFEELNSFKNGLLIPLYGTVLAIRFLYAAIRNDDDQFENCWISSELITYAGKDRLFFLWDMCTCGSGDCARCGYSDKWSSRSPCSIRNLVQTKWISCCCICR